MGTERELRNLRKQLLSVFEDEDALVLDDGSNVFAHETSPVMKRKKFIPFNKESENHRKNQFLVRLKVTII